MLAGRAAWPRAIPVSLRENSSFGAPIELSVSETEMWVNSAERAPAVRGHVQAARATGWSASFLYTAARRCAIELIRMR